MATHLSQLTTLAWGARTGTTTTFAKYPAGDISYEMLKGNMLENVTLMGVAGPFRRIPGPRYGELSFTTYPCGPGSGTFYPLPNFAYDAELLFACGMYRVPGTGLSQLEHLNGIANQTGFHRTDLYPAGAIIPVDFRLYIDQYLQTMKEAVGNFTLTIRSGEIVKCLWNFTGLWEANPSEDISDGSTGDEAFGCNGTGLPDYIPCPALNVVATIGGTGGISQEISEISLTSGNVILMREDITQDGFCVPIITRTESILTFVIEQPQLGTGGMDFWQEAIDANALTITATFGTDAGHLVTVDFSGYFNEYPVSSVVDGRLQLTGHILEEPETPFTFTY